MRGAIVSDAASREGQEEYASTVQPHAAGLAERIWYGAASTRSAVWAGQNGFRLLTSSVIQGELGNDFATNQRAQIDAYRAAHPAGADARVSQGLVVIPTDRATPEQRAAVEHFSQSLMNKFLHEPTVRLRSAAANGRGLGVVDAARYLFALDERHTADDDTVTPPAEDQR